MAGSAPSTGPAPDAADSPTGTSRIRAIVVGATGYVGAELIRLLDRHPNVELVGLVGRGRKDEPVGVSHPHLEPTRLVVDAATPDADVAFLALPHGASAAVVPDLVARGMTVVDLGADFRLKDPAQYAFWYGLEHAAPDLLAGAVYGLPELHRAELRALRADSGAPVVVGAPGCYPTATILACAPLARAGLIGDIVVDAKSGVSGAGKDPKPELTFAEVNESVRAYGTTGHRHVAEMEQELGRLDTVARSAGVTDPNPGVRAIDFVPHLIPMTRGILSAAHIRPTRRVTQEELDDLYRAAYAAEPFVSVVATPPATKHVLGSNQARIHVRLDERTGRILAIGVIDNLVKGAAGQAIQAFNVVADLPETAGLNQHPLAP